MFKAKDGCVLVGSDYSQQEPRLLATMSGDESMLKSYQQGKDLYATMGVGVYKNDYWDNMEHTKDGVFSAEGKKRRGNMKKLLLGITYQMGAKSISVSLNSSLEEAQQIVNNFYDGFPKIKRWMDDTKESCRKLGYVEDFWGRRRRLPDILLPKYEITDPKASETDTFNPLIGSLGKVQLKTNPKIKKYEAELDSVKDRKTANLIISQAEKDGLKVKDNNYFIAQAERQCVNARIQGCLSENELIYTKDGIVKIGELVGREVDVWDGKAWSKAHVEASGKKQKCKLVTSLGQEIICSPDHKFLVVNTRGTESFKKLSEIKSQDRIIFNSSVPDVNNEVSFRNSLGITYTGPVNKANYSFDDIKDNYIRGQVLGRIASDGSYIKRPDGGSCIYLLVAEHEKELLEFFSKYLPYKYTLRSTQKKNQKLYAMIIYSSTLVEECLALDIKHQIHSLFYKNTDLLRGFISGFFDGDGTSNGSVHLDFGIQSDFTKITRQMQDSLSAFGIRSKVYQYKDRYRVIILRHEAKLFAERIGFITKEKQEKALKMVAVRDNKRFNNKVVVGIKAIEKTNEYIDMYDVCDTDRGYFIVNGLVTHNSAATLTKMAMVKIFNDPELKRLGFKLSIAVHDELIGECPEENKDECAKRLSGLMIATAPENGVVCPMKCDSVVEKNWYTEDYTGELIEEYEENIEKNGMSPEQAKKHLVDDHEEASEEFFKNLFEKLNCA